VDFLSASPDQRIEQISGATLYDGSYVSFFFESNEVYPELDDDFDIILKRFAVRYKSNNDLLLTIYKNDSSEAMGVYVLPFDKQKKKFRLSPGARCSSFRWRIEGQLQIENQAVQISRIRAKYEIVPDGGTETSEA
jgi:hypothetical protein